MQAHLSSITVNDLFPETLLVARKGDRIYTTSRKVAEHFGKRHAHVMRVIKKLIDELPDPAFAEPNFGLSMYEVRGGKNTVRHETEYHLTHDGFALLAMGFTGKEALRWKVAFLQAFRAQEVELAATQARYLAALDQIRPSLRPVVEGTQAGYSRAEIAAPLGKSLAAITYHRASARRLGLLDFT